MSHLTQKETQRVRRLVNDYGIAVAAARLAAHHSVLSRVLAGIDIKPGSVRKLRASLASTDVTSPEPSQASTAPESLALSVTV